MDEAAFLALLVAHERERARQVAEASATVDSALLEALVPWEALAEVAGAQGDAQVALEALARLPDVVDLAAAEVVLALALVDAEALAADHAVTEAEALTDEDPEVELVGVFATAAVTTAVYWAVDAVSRRILAGLPFALVGDLRSFASFATARAVVTEATAAAASGAEAVMVTFATLVAVWRCEAGACPQCAPLAGEVITEATGHPPKHPNCRCGAVPWPAGKAVPEAVGAA